MKIRKAIALGAIALSASACNLPGTYWDAENERIQMVHLVAEFEIGRMHHTDFQPERIDVIMTPDELEMYWEDGIEISMDTRCARMGGELIWYPRTGQFICEDIDH